eukprot:scaffold8194_cov248-Pinguiococcus_pyrenoidosus.AAC.11
MQYHALSLANHSSQPTVHLGRIFPSDGARMPLSVGLRRLRCALAFCSWLSGLCLLPGCCGPLAHPPAPHGAFPVQEARRPCAAVHGLQGTVPAVPAAVRAVHQPALRKVTAGAEPACSAFDAGRMVGGTMAWSASVDRLAQPRLQHSRGDACDHAGIRRGWTPHP